MKYTKEFLTPLIESSTTMSEVVRKIGHRSTDTGFVTYLSKLAKKFDISTKHFKSKSEQAAMRSVNKRDINEYFSNKYPIASNALKKRLLREKIKKKECEKCGISKWLDEELSLHLHHIDLDHTNNNLNNLMILCPNCHSVVHKAKSTKSDVKKIKKSSLRPSSRKVSRPDFITLQQELENSSYCSVARKYGVSDNAIRKWVKMYNKYQ